MIFFLFFFFLHKIQQKEKNIYLALGCSINFQPSGGALTLIVWVDSNLVISCQNCSTLKYFEIYNQYLRYKKKTFFKFVFICGNFI